MTKSEGSRVGARAGTKSQIRKQCQRQTKRALRLGSKTRHYVGAAAVVPNGGPGAPERAPVKGSPSQSVYVLANRVRKVAFIAADEAEAREKAVKSGLVRKAENAKLIAVNP